MLDALMGPGRNQLVKARECAQIQCSFRYQCAAQDEANAKEKPDRQTFTRKNQSSWIHDCISPLSIPTLLRFKDATVCKAYLGGLCPLDG